MTTTPTTARTIAGLLGATLLAAATFGLAGCNKRDNTATTTTTPSTTSPAASDSMPPPPSASAASQ